MNKNTALIAIVAIILLMIAFKEQFPGFPAIGFSVGLGYIIGRLTIDDEE